jgi:two-component system response regulator
MLEKTQILLVEDEFIVAMDIREHLEQVGHKVLATVSSGMEAVQYAKSHSPDLVLMDVRLRGDMDGVDAARHIRSESNVPIIFLSAYSDEDTIARASEINPLAFVVKPLSLQDLQHIISVGLTGESTQDQGGDL